MAEAGMELFRPPDAPKRLLDAAAVTWPGRQLSWLILTRGKWAEPAARAVEETYRTREEVSRLLLGDGSLLHVGLHPQGYVGPLGAATDDQIRAA